MSAPGSVRSFLPGFAHVPVRILWGRLTFAYPMIVLRAREGSACPPSSAVGLSLLKSGRVSSPAWEGRGVGGDVSTFGSTNKFGGHTVTLRAWTIVDLCRQPGG